MNCSFCKQIKVKNKDVFPCDGCSKLVCKDCGNLTASEVKVLQLATGRVMKFFCPQCLNGESFELMKKLLDCKDSLIADKMTIIDLLKDEIETLRNATVMQKCSYSQALQAPKKQREEVIIIKPKDSAQKSEVTKKNIEEKINPCNLGVGVVKVKYVRDGGVAIKYNKENHEQTSQNMFDNIRSALGLNYEVKIPEKKNPRIILFNLSQAEVEVEDSFLDTLVVQNTINTDPNERELKVVHKYKNRKNMINVILQMDSKTYECIKRKEKLHIGWKSYFYKDSVNIRQCFNCWKYGHVAKDCRKETPTCQKCAKDHKEEDCQSVEICCVNCKYASEVLKIPSIDFKHRAYDRNCEAYKIIVKQVQEKIDYPEVHSYGNGSNKEI